LSLRAKAPRILGAKFLSVNRSNFGHNYLSLFQEMGYSILLTTIGPSQLLLEGYRDGVREEWVRIKPGVHLPEVLGELEVASLRLRRLKDCYLTVVVNECLEVFLLVGLACLGCTLNFNLGLLVLYVSKDALLELLQAWNRAEEGAGLRQAYWGSLNIVLFLYYLFMLKELYYAKDRPFLLFLFLLANRLFRTEPLQPRHSPLYFRLKVAGLAGLILGKTLMAWYLATEEFESGWLTVLVLPLLLEVYRRWFVMIE
jgi:hypothetical protein